MRPLIALLSLLALLPVPLSPAAAAAAPDQPPAGGIRLVDGFRHERLQGIDSRVGRIAKGGGLVIEYDIGHLAGNYAAAVKGPDRVWAVSQVVNGQPVEIVRGKDGRVVATFTKSFANFHAKVTSDEGLATFLAIVLTYAGEPAGK